MIISKFLFLTIDFFTLLCSSFESTDMSLVSFSLYYLYYMFVTLILLFVFIFLLFDLILSQLNAFFLLIFPFTPSSLLISFSPFQSILFLESKFFLLFLYSFSVFHFSFLFPIFIFIFIFI